MSKWIKEKLEVEAFRWTGDDTQQEDPSWFREAIDSRVARLDPGQDGNVFVVIETAHGPAKCQKGDYIIRGVKGELYPCAIEVFRASYRKVSEEVAAPSPVEAPGSQPTPESEEGQGNTEEVPPVMTGRPDESEG